LPDGIRQAPPVVIRIIGYRRQPCGLTCGGGLQPRRRYSPAPTPGQCLHESTCLPTILPPLDSQGGFSARSPGDRWRHVVITSANPQKKVQTGAVSNFIGPVDPLHSRGARCNAVRGIEQSYGNADGMQTVSWWWYACCEPHRCSCRSAMSMLCRRGATGNTASVWPC
jgi:hypothetical protein